MNKFREFSRTLNKQKKLMYWLRFLKFKNLSLLKVKSTYIQSTYVLCHSIRPQNEMPLFDLIYLRQ